MNVQPPDFLRDILDRQRGRVRASERSAPKQLLAERCGRRAPPRSLLDALSPAGGPVRIIAEVKRASPSAGAIAELDAAAQAGRYAAGGAAAISVLTEPTRFGGSLADLEAVRAAGALPLLRKDFLVDAYQLLEARAHGADAVLLIAAAFDARGLCELLGAAAGLGLDALVEVHSEREMDVALEAGARLLGINNRDLRSLQVDLATTERLARRIPSGLRWVTESGIRTPAEVSRLRQAGAANFLIGEALVRSAAPARLLRELVEAS